jgi:hypothetical protein
MIKLFIISCNLRQNKQTDIIQIKRKEINRKGLKFACFQLSDGNLLPVDMKHIKITWQSDQMREKDLGRGCSVP